MVRMARNVDPKAVGVDFGTSGTRAFLVNLRGEVLAQATRLSPVTTTKRGFLEQDMSRSARAGVEAVREMMEKAIASGKIDGNKDVIGIGTSGWMHGDVLIDESGDVLAPASMWNCPRSNPQADRISGTPELVDLFLRETGNEPFARMTIIKALHRMEEQPELWENTDRVMTPKDFWNYYLTGKMRQEPSDVIGAVGRDGNYSSALFRALGLENKFAPLVHPTDIVGGLMADIAEQMGLLAGTPVYAGGGDQLCGRIGNGVVSPGIVGFNLGSSGVTVAYNPGGKSDPTGRIHNFNDWLMACCMASGDSFKWWVERNNEGRNVDQLKPAKPLDFGDLIHSAAGVKPGANGVRFLPFLSGANHPVRDPNVKGGFSGLTMHTTTAEMTRAVLEGVAVEMVKCAKQMESYGINVKEARLAGGGARDITGTWPQIFADASGYPVTLNNVEDASGLGAAIIAMVGSGIYPTYSDACKNMISWGKTFNPNPDNASIYSDIARSYYREFSHQTGKRG